ncbi:Uncharacterized protein SSS_09982 [Sarcoptes scabiei]|uniref:Uncharacterized protein n=1 Tax=Sarcoptes scabiei TaxID=52283 RepID=A0A834R8Z2_SARSC|nr:Uncharacterized protein SSS_09982 [Sarcoptes scabiei]
MDRNPFHHRIADDNDDDGFKNASQIKNWITSKLEQLEEKNHLLEEENKKVHNELNRLKQKYHSRYKSFTPEAQRKYYHKRNNQKLGYHHGSSMMRNNFNLKFSDSSVTSSSSSLSSIDFIDDDDDDDIDHIHRKNYNLDLFNNINSRSDQVKAMKSNSLDRKWSRMKEKNSSSARYSRNKFYQKQSKKFSNAFALKKEIYLESENNQSPKTSSQQPPPSSSALSIQHPSSPSRSTALMMLPKDDFKNQRPPTPPLHRLPSWESRIYEIANNGIQSAITTPVHQFENRKLILDSFEKKIFPNHFDYEREDKNYYDVNDDDDHHRQQRQQQSSSNPIELKSVPNRLVSNNQHPIITMASDKMLLLSDNNHNDDQRSKQKSDSISTMTISENKCDDDLFPNVRSSSKSSKTTPTTKNKTTATTITTSTASSGNGSDLIFTNDNNEDDEKIRPKMSTKINDEIRNISNRSQSNNNENFFIEFCQDSLEKMKICSSSSSSSSNLNQTIFSSDRHRQQNLTANTHHSLEKSGYLYKLSGRFKIWKKRWFVLKDSELLYYKRKYDGLNYDGNGMQRQQQRKFGPKAKIFLDQNCSLIRSKEKRFHISYQDGKKNLHLACDSIQSFNDWLHVIGQTLTINNIIKLQDNQCPVIENYITKVRFGHSLKCWTALYSHHLIYFNNPFDKIPIGYTSLKDCTIKEITSIPDIEDVALIYDDLKKKNQFLISVNPKGNSEPIYLLFHSRQDSSLWHYHLKAALAETNMPKTLFENLLDCLLNVESSSSSRDEFYRNEIWNNPLLHCHPQHYSNGDGDQDYEPTISLCDVDLKKEQSILLKSIKLFISVPIDHTAAIDYHIALIQNCFQICLDYPELQAELYYQLIRQSSPTNEILSYSSSIINGHQSFWCAPKSLFNCDNLNKQTQSIENKSDAILDTISISLQQSLQFLSLAISILMPKNQVLWMLKHHIQRFKNQTNNFGQYFLYFEKALTRVLLNGPRKRIPSRMEVLSIIKRNPFLHSHPHSIPVHFANKSYLVIGFDGSTTVREFIEQINLEIGIRDNFLNGLSLFSDDPIEINVEHLLDLNGKLADAISYWESTLRKYNLGKFDPTKLIKLSYRHRLCFASHFKNETEKEKLIWIYEVNEEILRERFPITKDLAIELMSLLIQIEYGNYDECDRHDKILMIASQRFLPMKYHQDASLTEIVTKRWLELKNRSVSDCVRIYLNCTRKWYLFGSRLFPAKVISNLEYDDLASLYLYKFFTKYSKVWLAITENFIELLEFGSFRALFRIPYKSLLNTGHYKCFLTLTIDQNLMNQLISVNSQRKSCLIQSVDNSSTDNNHWSNGNFVNQRLIFSLFEPDNIAASTILNDYFEFFTKNNQSDYAECC